MYQVFNLLTPPPRQFEIVLGPSMTIPDQTMSIKDIMARFTRGLPIEGGKTPIYYGEENDFPDMSRLDISERQEIIENYQKELKDIQTRHQQRQASHEPKNGLKNDSTQSNNQQPAALGPDTQA